MAYLTPPGQIVVVEAALVEGDEEVGAGVAVGEGEFGGGHFFAGRFCIRRRVRLVRDWWVSCAHAVCENGIWCRRRRMGADWRIRVLGPPSPRPMASLIESVTAMLVVLSVRNGACNGWCGAEVRLRAGVFVRVSKPADARSRAAISDAGTGELSLTNSMMLRVWKQGAPEGCPLR